MTSIVALLLTLLTGFSGLVYEVTWQKYLATLLGSHAEATAAVLGLYLGGLSLGYAVFGRVTRTLTERAARRGRAPRLLLTYGIVEASIGLYAFAFPAVFRAAQALSIELPEAVGGGSFAADVLLSALLIVPPTVLMGGTIPVLTQGLSKSVLHSTRIHSLIYGSNTCGAFLGALAAGFWLVPELGLVHTVWAMGAINVVAGVVFVALGLSRPAPAADPAPGPSGSFEQARPRNFAAYAAIACLSGAAMMTLQTVLNRLGALSFGASHFTFSMVVAVFVLCIAIGSFAVSVLRRIPPGFVVLSQWLLAGILALLYFAVPRAPFAVAMLRAQFPLEASAFLPFYLTSFLLLLAILFVPVALSGALLPMLFHLLRRETSDLGSVSGRLYSWNTLGSLLGALGGGYAAFFVLDAHQLYRVTVAALGVAALGLGWALLGRRGRTACALAFVATCALLLAVPEWDPARLNSGLFRLQTRRAAARAEDADAFFAGMARSTRIRFHDDDPTQAVAVFETNARGKLQRSIHSNGKSDGGSLVDFQTMALAGILPALLAEEPPTRSFVIGLGTGVTAGELAALPSMEEVVVAEISPAVIEAAPLFDFVNHGSSRNPRIRHVAQDAYRALLRSEGTFDVIVSEPSNPWTVGVEMLFAEEFLRAAKGRLRPGGTYLQWFHLYETDLATIELVLRTYTEVFPRVAVWFSLSSDLLVVGFTGEEAPPLERVLERAEAPAYLAALHRMEIEDVPRLLAHEIVPFGALRREALPDEVHTLLHPILSHRAARAFFTGSRIDVAALTREIAGDGGASYLGLFADRQGGLSEEQRDDVRDEVCRYHPAVCRESEFWRRIHGLEPPPPAKDVERP